jgi:hypothetical protein
MQLPLELLPERFAVCRLAPHDPQPAWPAGAFVSVTRTRGELSVVCEETHVPAEVQAERGWRCLAVAGPIAFETTGVAAALVSPLADARISVFLVSTYDTDYLLLKADALDDALGVLAAAGHAIRR